MIDPETSTKEMRLQKAKKSPSQQNYRTVQADPEEEHLRVTELCTCFVLFVRDDTRTKIKPMNIQGTYIHALTEIKLQIY